MEMENIKKEKEQTKIVNLCEDMNPHEHNEESYKKMLDEQQTNNK